MSIQDSKIQNPWEGKPNLWVVSPKHQDTVQKAWVPKLRQDQVENSKYAPQINTPPFPFLPSQTSHLPWRPTWTVFRDSLYRMQPQFIYHGQTGAHVLMDSYTDVCGPNHCLIAGHFYTPKMEWDLLGTISTTIHAPGNGKTPFYLSIILPLLGLSMKPWLVILKFYVDKANFKLIEICLTLPLSGALGSKACTTTPDFSYHVKRKCCLTWSFTPGFFHQQNIKGLCFVFVLRQGLYSPGWPGPCGNPLASASLRLRLKACATTY